MKKSNILIFVIILLVVIGIFGYAIWDANRELSEFNSNQNEEMIGVDKQNNVEQNMVQENIVGINENTGTATDYVGKWYISENAYLNAEKVEEIIEEKEENKISTEEFENQMKSEINGSIVELDVENYLQNKIKFDFKLISPAPTQREARLEDISVDIVDGIGTFTYTDNWGTSGNGTITLSENKIQLKLETTKVAQGAQGGVEGVYTFLYKRVD